MKWDGPLTELGNDLDHDRREGNVVDETRGKSRDPGYDQYPDDQTVLLVHRQDPLLGLIANVLKKS